MNTNEDQLFFQYMNHSEHRHTSRTIVTNITNVYSFSNNLEIYLKCFSVISQVSLTEFV